MLIFFYKINLCKADSGKVFIVNSRDFICHMDKESLDIGTLDGYQFEDLVTKILKKRGYRELRSAPRSGDLGKDIIMTGPAGEVIIVECKHQHFVGRPIVQKLQGAMSHERTLHINKPIKGIIVTSGKFSDEAIEYRKQIQEEIELIDGKGLKELCKQLDIHILNGKVQIITNKCFKYINEIRAKKISFDAYSKIYGHERNKISVKAIPEFIPVCYLAHQINFDTYTSIGRVDRYSAKDRLILEGETGHDVDEKLADFFFSKDFVDTEIEKKYTRNKIPFEFTENDIEEQVLGRIIKAHAHSVHYRGANNVTYTKSCIPKKSDIDLTQFVSIYLPVWKNRAKIQQMEYAQNFYSKEESVLFVKDEFKICKICERSEDKYEEMSVCPECGRIVCNTHVKIDYLDKTTPICTIHAQSFKLFLQNKYFATKENRSKYKEVWESMNFFKKIYEDKIVLGLSVLGIVLLIWFLAHYL